MATGFTENTAVEAGTDSFANTPGPRLHTIVTSLTRHLHDLVRRSRDPGRCQHPLPSRTLRPDAVARRLMSGVNEAVGRYNRP